MPNLILVRGLPGSGKSTFARTLAAHHFENDMFFINDGIYKFDISQIDDAMELCQAKAREALSNGCDVVVSNTFTTNWEMEPYIEMAQELGAKLFIVKMESQFKNINNCPEEAFLRMERRWEKLSIQGDSE